MFTSLSLRVNYLLSNKDMDGRDETSKRILEPYQYLLQLPGKFAFTLLNIKIVFLTSFSFLGNICQEVYPFLICGVTIN